MIDVFDQISTRGKVEANRNIALVARVYNWGIEQALLESNPALRIKPWREESRERVVTEAEVPRIWAATYQLSPTMGAIYRLRLITGQRSGEIESMRSKDIDGPWWTIHAGSTKAKRSHRVYLADLALREIEAMPRTGSPWVFPADTKTGLVDNVVKALVRLRKLTGIDDWVGHDFRRTVSTFMGKLKIRKFDSSLVLNHAMPRDGTPRVSDVYDRHEYDDEKREALEKWEAHLEQIVAGNEMQGSAAD